MEYRRKPVAVDAVQWFQAGDHPQVLTGGCIGTCGYVRTEAGDILVAPGHWVVTDPDGSISVYRPGLFAEIYEPAETKGPEDHEL